MTRKTRDDGARAPEDSGAAERTVVTELPRFAVEEDALDPAERTSLTEAPSFDEEPTPVPGGSAALTDDDALEAILGGAPSGLVSPSAGVAERAPERPVRSEPRAPLALPPAADTDPSGPLAEHREPGPSTPPLLVRAPAAPAPFAPSAPSPPARPPLGAARGLPTSEGPRTPALSPLVDRAERPAQTLAPPPSGAASARQGRWVGVAAIVLLTAVGVAFVLAPRRSPDAAPEPGIADVEGAPPRPSDPPARAPHEGAEDTAPTPVEAAPARASIKPPDRARHVNAPGRWNRERVLALSAEGQPPPRFGFEPRDPTPKRPYDVQEVRPGGPKVLMVASQPPGMTVHLDGQLIGATPLARPIYKPASSFRVKLSGPGFEPVEASVGPDAEGNFHLGAVMEPSAPAPVPASPAPAAP